MATPNPIAKAYPDNPPACSQKSFCVAGILTTVYGLNELPTPRTGPKEAACLWLLHPRLGDQKSMTPMAHSAIYAWNTHRQQQSSATASHQGLIAVTFDQRNHGSRMVDPRTNEDWRHGNATHAQDMFSIYNGTALDTSHLLTHLPSYIAPQNEVLLTRHIVCGVSLGGHAAWQSLFAEPRITVGISVVGCPDYWRLMHDRAKLSKRPTAGPNFIPSKDFPGALLEAVKLYDPAALLAWTDNGPDGADPERGQRLHDVYVRCLAGKTMLNISGELDKLVPYRCSRPILDAMKKKSARLAAENTGVCFSLDDRIFPGVEHALSPEMAEEINRFLIKSLLEDDELKEAGLRHFSKM